eukprot:GEMP01018810.1.p1 GENE.GEMP01018810.1~~GEMP01018810.1.p1  ORF type:complete len:465 (+),score=83.26 GEMP01018810.1:67-1461(+)
MPRFDDNIILLTDSYKVSHHKQYPPGTQIVYSYFESRGGKFDSTVFFGLQYWIKRFLCGPIVTKAKIDQAEELCIQHLGDPNIFHRAGWEHILNKHKGYLPIVIKSVPEGTIVPVKNVLFTMENTDPECYWLTNYLETMLVQVWHPMTVATNSYEQKKVICQYMKNTGCDVAGLPYKLVDFGVRGSTTMEAAAVGGAAHLVNFRSTDNLPAIGMMMDYYSAAMPGNSIPAAEHSTITSWGRNREVDAFRNMLTAFPKGLVAVVSDSYNVYDACSDLWGSELKELIEQRDGTLIVRPDSGDPPVIVCELLEILTQKFGFTTTSTGHKLLPSYIRVIQGDGVSYEVIMLILETMMEKGFAADNLTFGSGGALLQKMDRDTQKCAFKCCYAKINGEDVDVFKDPITDPGKKSKKGRLTLEKTADGSFTTVMDSEGRPENDELVEVYRNGKLIKEWTLEEVQARCRVE